MILNILVVCTYSKGPSPQCPKGNSKFSLWIQLVSQSKTESWSTLFFNEKTHTQSSLWWCQSWAISTFCNLADLERKSFGPSQLEFTTPLQKVKFYPALWNKIVKILLPAKVHSNYERVFSLLTKKISIFYIYILKCWWEKLVFETLKQDQIVHMEGKIQFIL